MTWPPDWPPDVADYYSAWAKKYGWSPETIQAYSQFVERRRRLAESDLPRRYIRHEFEGSEYLYEVVPDLDGLTAIRVVLMTPAMDVHQYSWERAEDEAGMLPEGDFDMVAALAAGAYETTATHFHAGWAEDDG